MICSSRCRPPRTSLGVCATNGTAATTAIALARNDVVSEGVYPRERYYLTDGAGRHYAVAESDGTIHPDVWGESITQYIGFRATGAVTKSHSYGEERLGTASAPGLSFFRNRVYDQETGRWTQEDPIGIAGGINLYQFNGNDPASYDDPYGLCPPCMPLPFGAERLATSTVGELRSASERSMQPMYGRSLLVFGVSGTIGNLSGSGTIGAVRGGNLGASLNSPSAGASIDIGVKYRDASPREPTGSVSVGVGKHTGVTVTNETIMLNIGVSTPTSSPVTVTKDADSSVPATPMPILIEAKPDATRVCRVDC